jgi:hypothetical protein
MPEDARVSAIHACRCDQFRADVGHRECHRQAQFGRSVFAGGYRLPRFFQPQAMQFQHNNPIHRFHGENKKPPEGTAVRGLF